MIIYMGSSYCLVIGWTCVNVVDTVCYFCDVSNVFDVVSEVKDFVEKTFILSCVNLKERLFYMFINNTVHGTIYAEEIKQATKVLYLSQ